MRTSLTLPYDVVDLIALDVVHIPFPIDRPIDVSGAVAPSAVVCPHGVVQVVPLVPVGLHFTGNVVVCDPEVNTYICQ